MAGNIIRLKPLEFAHILNLNTNITYLETGPKSLILQENQIVVYGPSPFIVIPPGHYCKIISPAKLPVPYEQQAELKFGQEEVRFHQEPFPLYPGEELAHSFRSNYKMAIIKLPVVPSCKALKLQALVSFDDNGVERVAGEEWQIEGPRTYYPRPECKNLGIVEPCVILLGTALRLKAKQDLVDKNGKERMTGEEWLQRKPGSYLPGAYEEVLEIVKGITLTMHEALHMTAQRKLIDGLGKTRVCGEDWLVTSEDSQLYIPEVGEVIVEQKSRTVLKRDQYAVVLNPVDKSGKQQLGKRELRKGQTSFFLKPGEQLENGIQNAYLLEDNEALILSAAYAFTDTTGEEPVERSPGDVWMITGPQVYIPSVEVVVKVKRTPLALGKNEGIYVQNTKTGKVRTILGPTAYLLTENETYWPKPLSPIVEKMLAHGGCWGEGDIRKLAYFESSVDQCYATGKRDPIRIISYRVPPNAAVQVYDHQQQSARVVFGPNLVILEPAEEFNVLSLSAGKPKKQNALMSLAIMLGPDYITDIIEVETLDHARLSIKYAANNKFECIPGDKESEKKLFSVPDYVGFATKNIASRIRGCVARTSFDEFHRYSTKIVKEAVFGVDEKGCTRNALTFTENNMTVTNIDVQSIEPVDSHMRDSLLKSVQLAIEISTQSIELAASHEAAKNEQTARGKLEKNKLDNEKAAEDARRHLYELRAITAAVESSGHAKAEAEAQAEKSLIEGRSAIEAATLKTKAEEIEENAKLESLQKHRASEISYMKKMNELDIHKAKELARISATKSHDLVSSIGSETIKQIADAGPIAQMEMLKAIGLRSTIITDGSTPLNLYQGGNGLIHQM
ncbi:major vault protein-like [Hydractinia symbiolongicarpus]|uniref:major vault protein-like n=1 Tax=Hydractinia symbiolongicarpus TaxID=13093 RepID=UPI00254B6572|nr:major vault protein-like [Hydractinia symbiolongicarpus]